MAYIALIVEPLGADKASVISRIRKLHPSGIAEINAAITQSRPVLVRPLFSRDTPEFAEQLLSLLEFFESRSIPYQAFEIPDEAGFEITRVSGYYRITARRLRNIISARALSLKQQADAARREDGIEERD